MLKNSCKATSFDYDTHDCKSNVNKFYMRAGCPDHRSIRSRWQAFFNISAFHNNIICVELTK